MTLNEISPHLVSLQAAPFRVHRHRAMGTEFCLYLEALDQEHAEANERACFQAVFEEIDRVEAAFSRFRASSEISRLNRQAALGPVVTDPEVFRILAETQSIWLRPEERSILRWGGLAVRGDSPSERRMCPSPRRLLKLSQPVEWRWWRWMRNGGRCNFSSQVWNWTWAHSPRATRWTAPWSSCARPALRA
jgi:hypothetical protein